MRRTNSSGDVSLLRTRAISALRAFGVNLSMPARFKPDSDRKIFPGYIPSFNCEKPNRCLSVRQFSFAWPTKP